eukprot:TRINITY_DN15478_c0_g1_i7.p1 TRINITY_DN15478_c0_g1~~TRINITY_DN15478_c0_g1_i7.p1  ORF type:complete len:139 (-),score=74.67 TRINITY_DN15478_c0_g1_i7:138-509(-)
MGSSSRTRLVDTTVIIMMLNRIFLFCVLVPLTMSGPTLYKLDEEKNTAERVMVPVSSTVIPLSDLPELQVGFGFGVADKDKAKKPDYLKDIKLITSKNRHRFVAPGGVKKLTKEEFEAFRNQV